MGNVNLSPEEMKQIVGIKVTKNEETGDTYYNYYCTNGFSEWETEHSVSVDGLATDSVNARLDLGLVVGDVVEFVYGRAIGKYQPVKGANIIRPSKRRETA